MTDSIFSFSQTGRFKRLFKESFWIAAGQAIAVVGSLIGVKYLTELLNPVEYGELALAMTLAALVSQTLLSPLSAGATRFYSLALEKNTLKSYFEAIAKLSLIAGMAVIVFSLIVTVILASYGQTKWAWITFCAFIFSILSGYNAILNGIQQAARQRLIVSFHQGLDTWGRFVIAIILMLWLGATSTIALIGYVFGAMLVLVSQFIFIGKILAKNDISQKKELWGKKVWEYSWPFCFWGIFTWAQLASDRWALEIYSSTKDVGFYAILFQIGYFPMSMVTGVITELLTPIFFQRSGDASDARRNSDVRKMSLYLTLTSLLITSVAFLITYVFHEIIFKILVAKEYHSISYLLPWMTLTGGIFAAGQTMALKLMSQMKTQIMLLPKIITAITGVGLNFIGAYLWGLEGVIISGILYSLSYLAWMCILSKHKINT
jgi:O-antigen/teichoic acid export membrane protein